MSILHDWETTPQTIFGINIVAIVAPTQLTMTSNPITGSLITLLKAMFSNKKEVLA